MKYYFFLLGIVLFIRCGPAKLKFERPVDTRSRPIALQVKREYDFPQQQLTFHNRFDGARLNGVSQINDSVYRLLITPENVPINNSAYYAFAINSQNTQTIYLQFDYPEEYGHRYVPKQQWNENWITTPKTSLSQVGSRTQLRLENIYGEGLIAAQELQNSGHVAQWIENTTRK